MELEEAKEKLEDRIFSDFGDAVRDIIYYKDEYAIVLRDPIEDHNPEEDDNYDPDEDISDLIDIYENDEIYDYTIYRIEDGYCINTSGGYFGRDYAISCAKEDADEHSIEISGK